MVYFVAKGSCLKAFGGNYYIFALSVLSANGNGHRTCNFFESFGY